MQLRSGLCGNEMEVPRCPKIPFGPRMSFSWLKPSTAYFGMPATRPECRPSVHIIFDFDSILLFHSPSVIFVTGMCVLATIFRPVVPKTENVRERGSFGRTQTAFLDANSRVSTQAKCGPNTRQMTMCVSISKLTTSIYFWGRPHEAFHGKCRPATDSVVSLAASRIMRIVLGHKSPLFLLRGRWWWWWWWNRKVIPRGHGMWYDDISQLSQFGQTIKLHILVYGKWEYCFTF